MICIGCQREPRQIPEYRMFANANNTTPDKYVQREEGTYNPENGHFACTECYIAMGEPSSPRGWVAP